LSDYYDFLEKKRLLFTPRGFEVDKSDINPTLFDFQNDLTRYALRKGRAGLYADTGLGKTLMQAEWARLVCEETGGKVLIVAPLGVAKQTSKLIGDLLGTEIVYTRDGKPKGNITITNYENLKKFNSSDYVGLVLDESSILKSVGGAYKTMIFDMFRDTKYKLFCSATPWPNDMPEIANQCEGLGILSSRDMIATFFINREREWKLKGHAKDAFFHWLASWGMHLNYPSDLGYDDDGFILPPLNIIPEFVRVDYKKEGELVFMGLKGIRDRIKIRRITMDDRCHRVAELANNSTEQWIMWCGLNPESELLTKLIPDACEVAGKHSQEYKEQAFDDFVNKKIRVLVTKPKIAGHGLNFQQSWNSCSVGLTDSFESFYQYVRRQYRFGQTQEVNAYIVMADIEKEIYDNVLRKQEAAQKIGRELIKNISQYSMVEINEIYKGIKFGIEGFELPQFMRNGNHA